MMTNALLGLRHHVQDCRVELDRLIELGDRPEDMDKSETAALIALRSVAGHLTEAHKTLVRLTPE